MYDRVYTEVPFSTLQGKTLTAIEVERQTDDFIKFHTTEGETFKMYHEQDCCESVNIEDICGDLDDLIGSPILVAEEVVHIGESAEMKTRRLIDPSMPEPAESETWTFYKLDTAKGGVTIRWWGSSNGYYSESVSFRNITQKD